MKKITKSFLSLVLVIAMVTVHFITPISTLAAQLVSVTIDVNGGNELENNVINGTPGSTLSDIFAEQDESWILQFLNVRKQRTYLSGVVEAATGYPIDLENNLIYGDTNVKLMWGNSELYSDNIEIEAEAPNIGDVLELHEETGEFGIGIEVQDPSPRIGGDGLNFDVFDVPFESRSFMVRDCDDPIEENACLVPFEGEIEEGNKYYLSFYISINDNYYMTNDIRDVLTVNGNSPTLFDDVRTYENGDFKGAWVIVEMDPVANQSGNQPGDQPHVEQFEVEFNTDGGTEIASVTLNDGEKVQRPNPDPEKANHIFLGWFFDDQKTIEYDFDDPVHENRTIFAKWEEKNISISSTPSSVNFGEVHVSPEDHVQRVVTITNEGNVKITLGVSSPTSDGPFGTLSFNSVDLEPNESTDVTLIINKNADKASVAGEYSGNYVFTATEYGKEENTTLNVLATVTMIEDAPLTHTVTFDTDGGTAIDPVVVNHGESVGRPQIIPEKENYEFDEWCLDETKTQVYDFSNSITEDITIYARYTEIQQGSNDPQELDVSIVPNAVDFGTLYIGAEEDLTRDVTVTNHSDVDVEVEIDIPTNDGPFNIHAESNTFTVPAKGQQTITLSVDHGADKASVAGTYNGEFVFNYNEVGVQLGDSKTVGVTVVVAEEEITTPEMVTVTFDTDGGTPVPQAVTIEKGTAVQQPTQNPEKDNFEFDTWCADETKTQPYDFSSPVENDITLYARYTEIVQGGTDPVEVSIVVNPMNFDFGTFTIGSESDIYKTATVRNDSDVTVEVTISSPTNEGPFNALEIEPFTIAAGEEKNVSLLIDHGAQKAGVAGIYNGQYVFSYHAIGEQDSDEVLVQATVTVAGPVLEIIDNTNNQNYDPESDGAETGLTIKVSGNLADLVKIEVDGVLVPEGAVTLTSGSTIATFSPDFLSTLGDGAHTVKFFYQDGDVEATFNIGPVNSPAPLPTNGNNEERNPGTFDNIYSWIEVLGISAIVAATSTVILKKKHS